MGFFVESCSSVNMEPGSALILSYPREEKRRGEEEEEEEEEEKEERNEEEEEEEEREGKEKEVVVFPLFVPSLCLFSCFE